MNSEHIIFNISSDEEGWGETGGDGVGDDYDWISEFFGKVDKGGADNDVDDSDDVVLLNEFVLNPKPRSKDLDDDCVILDCDPDKPVVMENTTATADSDEELLIVGEKGQIACRDYPHPRHLCAKFPFTSNQYERHCHQCHCYVCDSLAPCVHWGNGASRVDHCLATDKDEFWKLQRRNFKQGGNIAPLPIPKLPDASLSTGPPQTIPVPPRTLLQPNSLAPNQVSGPTTIRACSTAAAKFAIPHITNQGRSQQPTYVVPRNNFRPHLVSQQLMSTHNDLSRRDRRPNASNLGSRFNNSHAISKRAGSAGIALTTNRSGYSSSINNHVTQYSSNPSPTAALTDKNPTRWQNFSSTMTSDSNAYQAHSMQQHTFSSFGNSVPSLPQVPSHQNGGSFFVNSLPSQPQCSSQPNMGSSFVNSAPSPLTSSRPHMGSNYGNSVPSQPQVSSNPSIVNSIVSSLPSLHVSSQPNMGSNFGNSVPCQPQLSSQPCIGSNFVNSVPSLQAFLQPNIGSNFGNSVTSQLLVSSQSNETIFSDFEKTWVASAGPSNEQSLADNSQIQSAGPIYPPLVTDFDPQFPLLSNSGSLDFHFDNWMMENQSVSVPSGLNTIYPPEPAPLDSGFHLDISKAV